MLKIKYHLFLPAIAFVVAFSACASTKIAKTWKDPEYHGYPKKVLILGMTRNPTVQIMFENQLVEQMGQHGVAALASHEFLPDDLVIDREALLTLVKDQGIDTVFIARPVSRKELQTLRPGGMTHVTGVYSSDDGDFTVAISANGYKPGTYAEEDVSMEMALYDVGTKKLIWWALASTYIWNTPEEEIKPGVRRIMKLLLNDKIIP